jgi:multimeric flavodoxin WrbA
MHVFILAGSRNKEGRTARCAGAIAGGLSKAGGTSEMVFLPTLNLERCRQCDPDGWGICRREGRCIIEDDFALLVEKLKSADAVIFANPVYFGDLSESMRGFLDRLRRIFFWQTEKPLKGKPAMGVCLAGGGGGGTPSACFNLENILRITGFNVVDVMPVRRQNIDARIPKLEMVGEWLATSPDIRPGTCRKLLKRFIRRMVYALIYLVYNRLARWKRKRNQR